MLDLSRADLAFDKLTLMRELPRAIAEGEMFLQYQPKVHVRRQQIASAEALVRWQHPVRGLILPGDFIAVAEEAGEIAALTLWTLRKVIVDQRVLAGEGRDLRLFINISGLLLADASFVAEACAIVRATDAKLGFEITETAVIRDPDSAIRHLQSFADIGVELAIDDYGAGLSSLAYLKQLPAKELKIDKMFVLQLTSSNRDPLIVRSTIDLAHALEMEVTAEGVETPSALALLSVMGCDMVQGFLISRPLGFDAFRKFVAEDGHLAPGGTGHSPFARPESIWKRA
ncbi:signal peptide protein [Sphingomonas hengshuiensis]|uniref:Signal peptide protein n=2 Tax=Sphingomonas hengshuiensis TaxID=1609977 RepID=A0A7U5BFX0_9SPHN|nr:signal peptide protein [Sphingomonas hengshuiensis]